MKVSRIALVALLLIPFAAQSASAGSRDAVVGAVLGGVLGGVIGNQVGGRDGAVVGAGVGAVAGIALAGNDRDDRRHYRGHHAPRGHYHPPRGHYHSPRHHKPVVVHHHHHHGKRGPSPRSRHYR